MFILSFIISSTFSVYMDICLSKYVCTDLCFQMKQSCGVIIVGIAWPAPHASSSLLMYSTDIFLPYLCEGELSWACISGKVPGEYQLNLETGQLECLVGLDSIAPGDRICSQRYCKAKLEMLPGSLH